MTDSFSEHEFFSECKRDFKVHLYKEIGSTNCELLKAGRAQLPFLSADGSLTAGGAAFNRTFYAALTQTAGHGRLGRRFVSPDVTGVYFSFSVVGELGIRDAASNTASPRLTPATVTEAACVGVCRSIERLFHVSCKIKWINDILCSGKKVCGILCEGIVNPATQKIEGCVIGIGINISAGDELKGALAGNAGGILDKAAFAKSGVPRLALAGACVNEICNIIERGEDIMGEYKERSFVIGKEITCSSLINPGERFTAKALDIESDGALLVETADGTVKRIYSEEVTLHTSS